MLIGDTMCAALNREIGELVDLAVK